jgi:hypothetical protein
MNTSADWHQSILEPEVLIPQTWQPEIICPPEHATWDAIRFGKEQIRSLVSQIFLPGRPKPARLVVFTPVDIETDVATICMQVGKVLSEQVSGSVCVVQPAFHLRADEVVAKTYHKRGLGDPKFGQLRNASRQMSGNLWIVPADIFGEGDATSLSTTPISGRVAELRLDFDYGVLCVPPAGRCGQAALLGHLCDGVVLVLDANSTRRAAAQKAKETLYAANTRLLGVVLNQRTFPIPDRLYRKL